MDLNVNGASSAQQVHQQQVDQHRHQTLGVAVQMINQAAGAPITQNFLDTASLDALMLAIMSDRAELLEGTLRTQVDEVRVKTES